MELRLIDGAKYTICITLCIVLIRFLAGLILGVLFSFLKERFYSLIYYLLNTFNYVPETFLAFIILAPIDAVFIWSFSAREQLFISLGALALIGIPNVAIQIASEIRLIKRKEFIESARVMGGGPFYILWKHIKPFLSAKMVWLIKQQIIQVLVVIVALAILGIRIAGADQHVEAPDITSKIPSNPTVVSAATSEWGGLIEQYRDQIWGHRWMFFDPAIAFCVTIISIQMMASAVLRVIQGEDRKRRRIKTPFLKRGKKEAEYDDNWSFAPAVNQEIIGRSR